jgi:hypothetical protein
MVNSRRHCFGRHFPTTLNSARQHLTAVLADLRVDERIEFFVHGEDKFAVLLAIRGEIFNL